MQPHFSHQNEATLFDPLEIVFAKIGLGRRVFYHTARSGGPESMRLALDVLEGENFAGVNYDSVGPRGPRAAELAAVDALDSDGSFFPPRNRPRPDRVPPQGVRTRE
jgi:hypothetical protein